MAVTNVELAIKVGEIVEKKYKDWADLKLRQSQVLKILKDELDTDKITKGMLRSAYKAKNLKWPNHKDSPQSDIAKNYLQDNIQDIEDGMYQQQDIAEKLGVSTATVGNAWKSLYDKHWPSYRGESEPETATAKAKAYIKEHFKEIEEGTCTQEQIAEFADCSSSTVNRAWNKLYNKPWPTTEDSEKRLARLKGHSGKTFSHEILECVEEGFAGLTLEELAMLMEEIITLLNCKDKHEFAITVLVANAIIGEPSNMKLVGKLAKCSDNTAGRICGMYNTKMVELTQRYSELKLAGEIK